MILIKYRGNWEPRFATADERDRLSPGLASGISCGYGRLSRVVEDSVRNRCNGNAFSADAIWAITRLWQLPSSIPSVLTVVDDMRTWPSEVQLEKFALMSDDQMDHYFEGLAVLLTMPRLTLLLWMTQFILLVIRLLLLVTQGLALVHLVITASTWLSMTALTRMWNGLKICGFACVFSRRKVVLSLLSLMVLRTTPPTA